MLSMIGFGLLSLLKYDSSIGQWVGYQIVAAVGTGILVRHSILVSEILVLKSPTRSTLRWSFPF